MGSDFNFKVKKSLDQLVDEFVLPAARSVALRAQPGVAARQLQRPVVRSEKCARPLQGARMF
jgi:hypothetical protein